MKKFTKLFVVALSVVLLVGAIVGVSAAAADDEVTYTNYGDIISSVNVSYADKLQLYFAIDVTHGNFKTDTKNTTTNNTGTTYNDGTIDSIVCKIGDKTYNLEAEPDKITINGNRPVYIVKTPGIAPKDILTDVTLTVKISGAVVKAETDGTTTTETGRTAYHYTDTVTYSVAEYFFERLYKNGVINATDADVLAQKELYLATLAYADAAQELLAPDAAKTLDDVIYVWGDVDAGLVESGYKLKLDDKKYSLEYYSLDEGVTGSDITNGAGAYLLNSSTKVDYAKETVEAPAGALTFGDYDEGDWTANTEGSVLVGYSGQSHPMYDVSVKKSSEANGNISTLVFDKYNTTRNGTANAMFWLVAENNSGVDSATTDLVFETRMRHDSSAKPTIRFYSGRTAANANNGSNIGEIAFSATQINGVDMGISNGEWFTLRIVISGGTNVSVYINGSENAITTKTLTTGKGACTAIQFTTSSTVFTKMEFEYMYFGAAPAAEATVTAPVGTRDYDYQGYTVAGAEESILSGGASLTDGSTSSNTSNYGYIKSEGDNKYVSVEDANSTIGQAIFRFANTNDLTDKDTLTLSFKMRINALANGTLDAVSNDYGIDLRVRGANTTSASNNVAQAMLTVVDGKVAIVDYRGQKLQGDVLSTEIDASEWFTVSISYSDNAETVTYTISDGVNEPAVLTATTIEDQRCTVATMKDFTVISMTKFMGILDIDDASIVASKAQ